MSLSRVGRRSGEVYLVGAGPGDPELLTVKALRLLQQADVVVYDRLVSKSILNLIRPSARLIFVGKARGRHRHTQDEINELLVQLTGRYRRIVRLKGGDPFVFGRGGEEAEYLTRHGVAVYVVPGITAASCASLVGIPLTHRGLARQVTFVAGNCRGNGPLDLDWKALSSADTTVVIYMGLQNLPQISRCLIKAGRDPMTPAALIENGATLHQRVHASTLAELPDACVSEAFEAPTLIIVGEVVRLLGVTKTTGVTEHAVAELVAYA